MIDAKVLSGFGVRSVTGSLRLDTDSDVAMARVLVAMANKSSADTARRVARAAKQQAIEGTWHGGQVPFGYRAENGTLVIDPDAAELVREAVRRVLAGESLCRIRADWNGRVDLAATLEADRERLTRLDDDHYDELIDKAMWVRQRGRIAARIERTRREYTATMPEQTGPGIDVITVAKEWAGRTPMWQYQATSLILQAVLVHALPEGMNGATPARRRNETVEAFHARRTVYRANVLAHRVEFIWRA